MTCSGAVFGQSSAPSQSAPTAAKAAPQTPAAGANPQTDIVATSEPASLAEMARLARAKKQGTVAKAAVKVLDDDTFQRSSYPADDKAVGGAAGSGVSGQSGGASGSTRGKFVLLDFWASWCGPCRAALPSLKRLQTVYGDQLHVISISADDDDATWRAFVASHGMQWEQKLDADGAMRTQYRVNVFPTYILLGPDGKVVQRLVGEDPTQSIAERLGPSLRANAGENR